MSHEHYLQNPPSGKREEFQNKMKGLVNDNFKMLAEFDKADQAKKPKPPAKNITKKLCLKAVIFLEEKKLTS